MTRHDLIQTRNVQISVGCIDRKILGHCSRSFWTLLCRLFVIIIVSTWQLYW